MFNFKITKKLSLYFTVTLLLFSIVIGSVFMLLFSRYTVNLNKQDLESKANNVSVSVANYLDNQRGNFQAFSMYLNVINDVADSDIWIVDQDYNLITSKNPKSHNKFEYSDLPENANKLIEEVLENKVVFSEDFSKILENPSLTVGSPIIGENNNVLGAVLMHTPIVGVNLAINQGLMILLISSLLAFALSMLLSVFLSKRFTEPLVKMNQSALRLANADYEVKTNVNQDDEIGELANTIDVLAKKLKVASIESKKLEKMRQEFIANISHELKTPVTVMRGSLEALADQVVVDENLVLEYYDQMLNEAKFLERLIKDLLELSKLSSLDFKIVKSNISINEIISDVIRSIRPFADSKKVNIEVNKNVADIKILGDYGRIRQMLIVIIENAVKFSKQNSKVLITLNNDNIEIKDKGIGIKKDEVDYIFERFQKSRSEINKEGTGLGLAIAKSIADRHNIKLKVDSKKDVGTTFYIKFNDVTQL